MQIKGLERFELKDIFMFPYVDELGTIKDKYFIMDIYLVSVWSNGIIIVHSMYKKKKLCQYQFDRKINVESVVVN